MFFDVLKFVFSECVFNALYMEINTNVETNPSNKINATKNALFFHSRAPTHHSFTFNLRYLYDPKHKIRLSKNVFEIFHFQFRFVFIKIYILVQENPSTR